MASIKERNGKYCVIYTYIDESGNKKQKWETYKTKAEAKQRKKEIEYKEGLGQFIIPQCKYLRELLDEYVSLYGRDKWSLSTYDRNTGLINNYIRPMIGDILDEDRKRNAELFEEAFYGKKNLNPQMIDAGTEKMITVPDGVDAETLMKVLGNPEMVALLSSLAKTIQK